MCDEQVVVAADCLHLGPAVAATLVHQLRDGIICVSSDVRGFGSVLVGPDLSVLFFASSVSPEQALVAWARAAGRRVNRLWRSCHKPNASAQPPWSACTTA